MDASIRIVGRSVRAFVLLVVGLACVAAAAVAAERRIALVIGNGKYKVDPLDNPLHDANDMAAALREAGFEVIARTNANTREMRQAVREFGTALRRADVGLFYFAGHGVQVSGTNYLLPVATEIHGEADIEDLSLDVNYVLRTMEDAQANVRILILDACRNNPYPRSTRSGLRGLAPVTAATGSFVAFATAPGSVAAEGQGRNGVYTAHLLESLRQADTDIGRVFQRTRAAVVRATGGRQTPWEATSLIGEFHFRPAGQSTAVAATPAAPVDASANDRAYWESVKDSKRPAEVRSYLEQFPNGVFAALARTRLAAMREQPAAVAAAASSPPATEPARTAAPSAPTASTSALPPSTLSYGGVTSQVQKNRTTQLELVQMFGGPSISTTDAEGNEVWVYERAVSETERQNKSEGYQAAANLGLFFSAVGIGASGSTGKSSQSSQTTTSFRSLTVIVKFNPDKTVKEYSVRASQF